jgi:hypothetical protein
MTGIHGLGANRGDGFWRKRIEVDVEVLRFILGSLFEGIS